MKNIQELSKFLFDANMAGFASGNPKQWIKEHDSSTTISYEKGDFKSHDNFFGGEPYGGRIIVHHTNKPVWIMVYYGWVKKGILPDPVYSVLKQALQKMPLDAPFRGPKLLQLPPYTYTNSYEGTVESYRGREQITQEKTIIYEASYMGGLVDEQP